MGDQAAFVEGDAAAGIALQRATAAGTTAATTTSTSPTLPSAAAPLPALPAAAVTVPVPAAVPEALGAALLAAAVTSTAAGSGGRIRRSSSVRLQEENLQRRETLDRAGLPESRLVLNVGGRRYETYLSTLAKFPDSLLATMFIDRNLSLLKPDSHGEYFFDRNADAFAVILDFYRTGQLLRPASLSVALLREEIAFFQLPLSDDEIEIQLAGDRAGDRLRALSLAVASRQQHEVLEALMAAVLSAVQAAAALGCRSVGIDLLKAHSYLRRSSGVDATASRQYYVNVVDKRLTKFLKDDNNVFLFRRRLAAENIAFSLQPIKSSNLAKNLCLTVQLWERPDG